MENLNDGENSQTTVEERLKISKIQDYLEKELVTSRGLTDREIKIYLAGIVDSLQYFGAITETQRADLYSMYCF
jgi:hypothetical protein